MPRIIAAGLDGSRESLAAVDWAARESLLRDLPCRLVHAGVLQSYDYDTAYTPPGPGLRRHWGGARGRQGRRGCRGRRGKPREGGGVT